MQAIITEMLPSRGAAWQSRLKCMVFLPGPAGARQNRSTLTPVIRQNCPIRRPRQAIQGEYQ